MVNKNNLCNNKEESTDHILIHYNKTRELWTFLLALFGLVWVFPTSMIDLLLQWKVRALQKKKMAVCSNLFILVYLERTQLIEGLSKINNSPTKV